MNLYSSHCLRQSVRTSGQDTVRNCANYRLSLTRRPGERAERSQTRMVRPSRG